jgi:hypothetical protein
MLISFFRFLICFCLCSCAYATPDATKQAYGIKMYQAFQMQSIGLTTEAYLCFKKAVESAREAKEDPRKLVIIEELFRWYRKYGWSVGIMAKPSGCTDECRCSNGNLYFIPDESQLLLFADRVPGGDFNYQSEWGKTPEQAAIIQKFMFGAGLFISGVLCVSISPPLLGPYGSKMLFTGGVQMGLSLIDLNREYQTRVRELKTIQTKAERIVQETK